MTSTQTHLDKVPLSSQIRPPPPTHTLKKSPRHFPVKKSATLSESLLHARLRQVFFAGLRTSKNSRVPLGRRHTVYRILDRAR